LASSPGIKLLFILRGEEGRNGRTILPGHYQMAAFEWFLCQNFFMPPQTKQEAVNQQRNNHSKLELIDRATSPPT
jgi:hypothetical protein